jgi:hypothetical protein
MRIYFILLACSFVLTACTLEKAHLTQTSDASLYKQAKEKIEPQHQVSQSQPPVKEHNTVLSKSETTFFVASRPEEILAQKTSDLESLSAQIKRQNIARLEKLSGTKKASVEQLPLLTSTREGRSFLAMNPDARAFVQASPSNTCPVRATGEDDDSPEWAVNVAMKSCFKALDTIGIADRCGCQLMVKNSVLVDEMDAFAYARGVSTVVFQPNTTEAHLYIAEEIIQDSPDYSLRFFNLDQELGIANLTQDGSLQATIDNKKYNGHWYAEGYRRGHMIIRLFLSSLEHNDRLIVLVGYEPQDFQERFSEISQWVERD